MLSTEGLKIGIIGTRETTGFTDYHEIRDLVARLHAKYPNMTLISGGARGVDSLAENAAMGEKIRHVKIYRPVHSQNHDSYFVSLKQEFHTPDGKYYGGTVSPLCDNITGEGHYKTRIAAIWARNKMICEDADILVGVWNGISRGTRGTLRMMMQMDKFAVIYRKHEWVTTDYLNI